MGRPGRPRKYEIKESEEELYKLFRKARTVTQRTRYQALWLLKTGVTMDEAARIVGVQYCTLQQIVAWYREEGLSAMEGHRRGGARANKDTPPPKTKVNEKEANTKVDQEADENA